MDTDFIDDDSFEAKKIEAEMKRQKKIAKQERLTQKKHLLSDLHNLLNQNKEHVSTDFEVCLNNANRFKEGTKEWAIAFFNLNHAVDIKLIREKYLYLAQSWHPDKNSQIPPAAMKYLNEAWQILKKNI